ncbi:cutinase family protein [Cryptosporangium sp. NPDC048952]|uniref:cutinase family protein n=1 Tax=Cryptosporangium sp. NPDC048952 TaxID=3363961 RepID=UPI003718AD10
MSQLSPHPWRLRALTVVVLLAGAALVGGSAPAAAGSPGCGDLAVVFARGSGQRLAQRESVAFLSALSARLGETVRATAYELGTAAYGGARYPAVGVGVDSGDSFANLLDAGAYWTGNEGHRYRASVAAGVKELRAYLAQRSESCPTERIVLSGYSQGAQVVGDTVTGLSREVRDRIAFVGLFGDPKLSLPEGRGIFPVGCRGKSLSPWRRGSASCYTDNGILDARTPYVPADLAKRTGSWCDRDDPICNSNLADFLHSTHGRYAQPGRAVDQAAAEAATAVRAALSALGAPSVPADSGTHAAPSAHAGSGGAGEPGGPGGGGADEPTPSASPRAGLPRAGLPEAGSTAASSGAESSGAESSGAGAPAAAGSPGVGVPAGGGDRPSASSSVASISPEATTGGGAPASGTSVPRSGGPALAIDGYWTRPGSSVTFAVVGGAEGSYRWDFDGDGTTDRTTTQPTVEHTYAQPFAGRARVQVSGTEAVASVHVDRVGLARQLPTGPATVTVRAAHEPDGAVVQWSPAADTGRIDAWRIHDADGRLLAHLPGSARQADLPRLPDRTTELTVEAINEFGSSEPEVAAPRGVGSSRFAAVPASTGLVVAGTSRAGGVAEPRLTKGLVGVAVGLLLATGGTLMIRVLGHGRGGRHRRSRRI